MTAPGPIARGRGEVHAGHDTLDHERGLTAGWIAHGAGLNVAPEGAPEVYARGWRQGWKAAHEKSVGRAAA